MRKSASKQFALLRGNMEETEMETDKKLTCTTCGGDLVADKEKHIYKCAYCGVAYGYGLFDGTAADKAAKALSIGEFNDADLYYTFVLSMYPNDFTALRGRVFCAGKWKWTTDLRTGKGELTGVRADSVRQRCDEAMKKVSEEDRKYFQMIRDFVDFSEKYHIAKNKARPIKEKQKVLSDRANDVDLRVSDMQRSYERTRSRNLSLTDLLLDRPGNTPVPNALQSAQDMSDVMHSAMSDTQKEVMKYNREINDCEFKRNDLYHKIVLFENKKFPEN